MYVMEVPEAIDPHIVMLPWTVFVIDEPGVVPVVEPDDEPEVITPFTHVVLLDQFVE